MSKGEIPGYYFHMEDDQLRIGQAATLLGVSVDTLRRWEEGGDLRLERSDGGHRLVPLTEVRRLLAERSTPRPTISASSARNQLDAVVTRVERDRASAVVEMQAGPFRLAALITADSARELELEAGRRVLAMVKATDVVVGLPED